MKSIAVLGAFATVLIAGCGPAATSRQEMGQRPQRMQTAANIAPNEFVGVWASPASDSVNDWIVIFTPNGYVAVDGPGMTADGTYEAAGSIANAAYDSRNGKSKIQRDLSKTTFKLSADGQALVFSTGETLDPPVKLVRSTDPSGVMPRPSLKSATDPDEPVSPFALATLSRN